MARERRTPERGNTVMSTALGDIRERRLQRAENVETCPQGHRKIKGLGCRTCIDVGARLSERGNVALRVAVVGALALFIATLAIRFGPAADATPQTVTQAQCERALAQEGATQAHIEQDVFDGYTGSLSEVPHPGQNGTWYFKTKNYDGSGAPFASCQISYRMPADDYPGGVWHLKTGIWLD